VKPCDDRLADLVAPEELDAHARADLERHLASCAGCRAAGAELRETTAALQETSFEPDELSALRFATQTANRAEQRRDRSVAGLWWFLPRPQRWAVAFSALALAAAAGLFAGTLRSPKRAEPVATAAVEPVSADLADWLAQRTPDTGDEGADSLTLDLAEEDAADGISIDDAFSELTADEIEALSGALEHS